MARVSINHNCGCGFTTRHLEEAIAHSDAQKHTLTVLGTITGRRVIVAADRVIPIDTEFGSLRNKLGKGEY